MASFTENCANCHLTFYQQSLNPLKLEEFLFGGHKSPSLACFVENNSKSFHPGSPKVCNTCLVLVKDSHVVTKRTFLENRTSNLPAYACATCNHLCPANNLVNMRLTLIGFNGRQINLEECAKVFLKQTIRSDASLMICLACLSVIAEEYQRRAENEDRKEVSNQIMEPTIKQEPVDQDFSHSEAVLMTPPVIKMEVFEQPQVADDKPQYLSHDHICPICHEDFPNYSTRERHRRKVHGKVKKRVRKHNRKHEKQTVYLCAHCPSTFRNKSWLTIHMNNHRSDHAMRRFKCHHCPKWYRTKRQVRDHLEIKHFPKKTGEILKKKSFYTCGICSNVYYDRKEYQTHLKTHKELDKLQCAVCKKTFKTTYVYIRHVQQQKQLHSCTKCDMAFHSKGLYENHLKWEHNESYVCEICNLPLFTRRTFEVHQQSRHGISVKSQCKYCGETIDGIDKLKVHMAQHQKTRKKSLVCEQCGRAYPTEHDLRMHLESHSEKLECHLCHKKLKNSDTLANHIKNMHSGRKTDKIEYPCPECPISFSRRQHLEGHMIVHNKEDRPYFQCKMCGIAYTRRQKLQVHVVKCPKLSTL